MPEKRVLLVLTQVTLILRSSRALNPKPETRAPSLMRGDLALYPYLEVHG